MRRLSRSENMSRIRSRGTRPEIELRRALWRKGLRYRLKYDLPGRPDLTFVGQRVAVFVDGCFWHGCPIHYSGPSTRQDFWAKKLRDNVRRDLAVDDALEGLGWRPLHVWQHELKTLQRLVRRILVSLMQDSLPGGRPGSATNEVSALRTARQEASSAPWYQCLCGSRNVRVFAVSNPGSLRPKARQRPRQTELVCVTCRHVFRRSPERSLAENN